MKRRDEAGQITLLIIGFAAILMMALVLVVNASAAYLQRQGLDNLADGAALYGADLGSAGVYDLGLDTERLAQEEQAVKASVTEYLIRANAQAKYPGVRIVSAEVNRANRSVTVHLVAPLKLPLRIPGSPSSFDIGASSTAAVTITTEDQPEPPTGPPTDGPTGPPTDGPTGPPTDRP